MFNEKKKNAQQQRLTKYGHDVCNDTIADIVANDMLKLQCKCGTRTMLENLLWPVNTSIPNALQDAAARFLNALVSTKEGRDYFGKRSVIDTLVWGETSYGDILVYRGDIDVNVAENLMAALMKLSLQPQQRHDMINKGLIKWLIKHMEDVEYSASRYHHEHMCALFMILSQHHSSLAHIGDKVVLVLSLLVRYLRQPPEMAATYQPYVRVGLIELLKDYRIAGCAKSIYFSEVIRQLAKV